MPSISMFQGIVISMHWKEHNPPHFHASYQEYEASFDFDGNITAGSFPGPQKKLVAAWAILHAEELKGNWRLAEMDESLYRIDPLK